MRKQRMLKLVTGDDETRQHLRSTTLVVCNNPIQLERIGIEGAELAGVSRMVAISLAPISKLARVFWPYAGYQRVFGENLEPTWESATLRIVGVNSTSPRRHKHGELSEATIRRACDRLRTAGPFRLQIVALHHPLHVITAADRANLAHSHHAALHAFADAGADLVLGGHIHLAYVRPLRAQIPTLSRELWVVQAGTSISNRVRRTQANSIHVIRAQPEEDHAGSLMRGCSVEQWDHSASEQRFVHVCTTRMDRES